MFINGFIETRAGDEESEGDEGREEPFEEDDDARGRSLPPPQMQINEEEKEKAKERHRSEDSPRLGGPRDVVEPHQVVDVVMEESDDGNENRKKTKKKKPQAQPSAPSKRLPARASRVEKKKKISKFDCQLEFYKRSSLLFLIILESLLLYC